MSDNWILPAIALAFLLGAFIAPWFSRKYRKGKHQSVNKDYFKGLNFLLNEEPDKAIEVFIKALEVDSETVELHLALGGLFRRKGQVDRATRIHQNLIARPNLTDDQRMQSVHELAYDYYKAGWLDRAENLFLELKDSKAYRPLAIIGLCRIYEQEKEWQKAIDVLNLHRRAERSNVSKQMTHYHCELADAAIERGDYEFARTQLDLARAANTDVARTLLLRGDLSFAEGNYQSALKYWEQLAFAHPRLTELVVGKMINGFQLCSDESGLHTYLKEVSAIPKDASAFASWQQALFEFLGKDQAIEHIFSLSQESEMSTPLANFLLNQIESDNLDSSRKRSLLSQLLANMGQQSIEYQCSSCGFDTKSMYWFCPNCSTWDSFR